jgi:hypothetical protein
MRSSFLKLNLLVCLAAVVMLLTGSPASPQSAGFTGTVLDPTGASVAGAQVTITNEATGAPRSATSEADGRFVFNQLNPGKYKVEVKAGGFKTTVRQHVELLVGITSTLDIRLEVGTVAETVTVSEQVAPLNTSDASIGRPISGNELAALPTLDMNPAGLLGLQTGVAYIPSPGDHPGGYGGTSDQDGRSGAVNGARSDQSNVTLDGIDVNDPQKGFAFTTVLRVPQDALEEFRTTTTSYDADSGGRSSSAQVQLVTKSGTNNLHGSLYYAHRNEAFNANDFFLNRSSLPQPKFRHHLYGGSVGGPVIKNRVFLFGDFERLQESLFSSAERSVPSVAFKDGVLFYQCRNFDPTTDSSQFASNPACAPPAGGFVQGVSGTSYGMNSKNQPCRSGSAGCGAIPQGFYALSPAQIASIDPLHIGPNLALLSYWSAFPDPNSSGSQDGTNVLGFRFGAPVINLYNTAVVRADVHLDHADKHTIFWRGSLMHDTVNVEPQFPGQPPKQTLLNNNKGFSVGYTAVLSQRLVNNFHYGLTRISDKTGGIRNQEFVWTRLIDDLKGFVDASTEIFTSSNGRILPQHHFSDDVSWTRGVHTFSFGGEFRRTRNSTFANGNSFPTFTINPSWLPLGGSNIEPGNSSCTQTGCTAVPLNGGGGSTFHDLLTEMYGPISFLEAHYNFDKTGATLAEGKPVRRTVGVNEYELYAQDKWRLKPSFTLTAGVRWYLSSPPWETNGNQVTPTPSFHDWFNCRAQAMNAGNPTSDCGLIKTDLGGPANGKPGYYGYDYKDFSPRLAFAWAPRFKDGLKRALFGEGKTSIRGGYAIVYDRIGNGIASSFNDVGSFGMSTTIDSFFGGCGLGTEGTPSQGQRPCVRFSGINDTDPVKAATNLCGNPPAPCLVPSPGATFPATPPSGLLTVSQGLDDKIKSPYAHTLDLAVARELKGGMTLEVAYVGRLAHRLTLIRDYGMPADLRDPKAGVTGFKAAQMLEGYAAKNANVPFQGLTTISPSAVSSFWQDVFPGFGASGPNQGCLLFNVFGLATNANGSAPTPTQCHNTGLPDGYTATQVAYDYMIGYHGTAAGPAFGTSTFWQDVDYFASPATPACLNRAGTCPNTFFPAQYVNLNTWTTTGYSFYHAMQVSLQKNVSHGVSFTLNYTYSHSLDTSSTPERQDVISGAGFGGYTGVTINAWDIRKEYSNSDFDIRHQFNGYWVAEFPFGRGKALGSNVSGWADHIIGGWQLSGIVHANSGVPANVVNGRTWPTSWDLQGNATCAPAGAYPLGLDVGPCPGTQNVHGAVHGSGSAASQPTPNLFANPDQAIKLFRFTATGDRGQRNVIRADKYESLDAGLAKTFKLPREGMSFVLHWDVFNVLNSVYFDAGNLNASPQNPGTFGDYTQVLGHPRQMQLSLRFQF